jgi:GT2 family glycosyltransferase
VTNSANKPNSTEPSVTVLVLHWRGMEKTRRCLTSLRATSYQNSHVLLVANGSPDGDSAQLATEFPEVEVLTLDRNYGFAGGCNRGMEKALADQADFIWLLNNDAIAKPESIEHLVKAAIANPEAGALGAIVLEGHSSTAEEAGLGEINFKKAKTYLRKTGQDKSSSQNSTQQEKGGYSCSWLSGSNLLLRSSALAKVGLFDERYYLYFEDVELCKRLTDAGFKCLLVPGSTIEHEGNASTQGGLSLWRSYYHSRNRLLFFMQYCSPSQRPIALLSIWGHFIKHCFTLPLRGKAGRARLKAEWLGLNDYYSKRLGPATCLDWCESVKL